MLTNLPLPEYRWRWCIDSSFLLDPTLDHSLASGDTPLFPWSDEREVYNPSRLNCTNNTLPRRYTLGQAEARTYKQALNSAPIRLRRKSDDCHKTNTRPTSHCQLTDKHC